MKSVLVILALLVDHHTAVAIVQVISPVIERSTVPGVPDRIKYVHHIQYGRAGTVSSYSGDGTKQLKRQVSGVPGASSGGSGPIRVTISLQSVADGAGGTRPDGSDSGTVITPDSSDLGNVALGGLTGGLPLADAGRGQTFESQVSELPLVDVGQGPTLENQVSELPLIDVGQGPTFESLVGGLPLAGVGEGPTSGVVAGGLLLVNGAGGSLLGPGAGKPSSTTGAGAAKSSMETGTGSGTATDAGSRRRRSNTHHLPTKVNHALPPASAPVFEGRTRRSPMDGRLRPNKG